MKWRKYVAQAWKNVPVHIIIWVERLRYIINENGFRGCIKYFCINCVITSGINRQTCLCRFEFCNSSFPLLTWSKWAVNCIGLRHLICNWMKNIWNVNSCWNMQVGWSLSKIFQGIMLKFLGNFLKFLHVHGIISVVLALKFQKFNCRRHYIIHGRR